MTASRPTTQPEPEHATDPARSSALDIPHSSLPVIVRLRAMQQRARRLLLIHGVALAVLGGAGAMLALFILDWALWFPSLLRFGFGVAWLVLLAWIISRHIWPPLCSRLSTMHVATKIEEHFPEFEDRLTSAVSFISEDYTLENPLQEKLIERTERIALSVPMENALTAAPAWRTAGLAVLPLAAMVVLAVVGPNWISTGAHRFLLPFASIHWPRTVHIQPLTEDLLIVSGESVVVSMEVTKGQRESLRAYLFMSVPGGLEKTAMRREGPAQRDQPAAPAQRDQPAAPAQRDRPGMPARYAWTINTVTQDIRYWFEAGDDSTEDRPGRVRVVSRPRVTGLRLTVYPPPYVLSAATEEASGFRLQARGASLGARSPGSGAFRSAAADTVDLIIGSTLELSFESSKALARAATGSPDVWISTGTGDRIGATIGTAAADSGRLVVRLMPTRDQQYEIHLLDEDGFENEPTEIVTVAVHQDAAPTVAILRPVRVLEVTPQGAVRIIGVARDDLGISRIELSGQVLSAGFGGRAESGAADRPFAREIRDWTRDESALPGGIAVRVDFDWALGELDLNVGDRVEYTLSAQDNRTTETLAPQSGRTYAMHLVVVSEADFAAGVGDELKRLADRLGLLLRRQEQLLTDTERHAEMIQRSPDFDPDAQLLRLSARQRRLAERVASVRKSAQSLADELIRNRISERSEKQQADVFADHLRNLVEPDMHQAAAILNDARGEAARPAQRDAVDQARAHEQAAIVAIRALLDQLTQWNDYRSMLANLRDLVDLQQQVGRQTAAAGDKTLGRDPDDLSDEERAELQRTAKSQDGITEAIDRAVAELRKLQAKLRSSEPDDARALADAERKLAGTGAGSASAKRSQSAADAIRDNKTAQAQSEQNSVERALADAVSQLEAREQRKLAELSKKLGNLEDLVLRILEQQEEIRTATQQTSAQDVDRELPRLAGQQRNLARGTRDAVETLASVPKTGEAVQQVRRAAEAMSRATDGLYEIDGEQAVQAQDEALDYLQLAIDVLAELREKNEQAIAKAKLIAIKRELLDVRAVQIEINTESERVIQRVHQAGRLTRIDVRRARKQAQAQEALIDKLSEVQGKLDDTPVYAWVVAKVLAAMQASRQMLADTQLEKPLTRAQQRAVSLLDQLIDAIKQAESMIEEQFAEGGGAAGGGPSQMGKQKPVPTVAELIVLRGVQQDLAVRTQALAEAMDADQPTEEQLDDAKALGDEQRELKQLTQELTARARGGP